MLRNHISDLIHAAVVTVIALLATVYAIETTDHSSNIWIVYGSAIAFAAGRAGSVAIRTLGQRSSDQNGQQ
jgi:hypothetical protein